MTRHDITAEMIEKKAAYQKPELVVLDAAKETTNGVRVTLQDGRNRS